MIDFDWLKGLEKPPADCDFCLTPDQLTNLLENLAKEMAEDAATSSPEPD